MAYKLLPRIFEETTGRPFETLESMISEERLGLFDGFIRRHSSPFETRFIFYCMKHCFETNEGQVRIVTGKPAAAHSANVGLSALEQDWGPLMATNLCGGFLHDDIETKVDTEYEILPAPKIEELILSDQIRRPRLGDPKSAFPAEEKLPEEVVKERKIKTILRRKYISQLESDLFGFLRENSIHGKKAYKQAGHIINIAKKLSRYGSTDQSYPGYLKGIFTTERTTRGITTTDPEYISAISRKMEDRIDNIKCMNTPLTDTHIDASPAFITTLWEFYDPEDMSRFDAYRETIREMLNIVKQNGGEGFSGQKQLYECAKNVLVLLFSRAHFGRKQYKYKEQLMQVEQTLIEETAEALDKHRQLLKAAYILPPFDDHLRSVLQEYHAKGGFTGISERKSTEERSAEDPAFLELDGTLPKYVQMMKKDKKAIEEMKKVAQSEDVQFQDCSVLLEFTNCFKDPDFIPNIERKIIYDPHRGMYVPTGERITW
ncbi:MAG: hypothetical protein V1743_05165 [Nanoarchaeota archaeon]